MDSPAFYPVSPTRPRKKNDSPPKLLTKLPLKSSIPVPAPVQRRDGRSRSASSCYSQPVYSSSSPRSMFERDKTSLSLSSASKATPLPKKPPIRPKTASGLKNQYANVKSKVDNNPPGSTSHTKSQFPHPKLALRDSNESLDNSTKKSNVESTEESNCEAKSQKYEAKSQKCEAKSQKSDEIVEKQRQLLTIYNELKKLQPSEELQPLEVEICSMMEKKTLGQLEGLSKANAFVQECTPEFLSTFEKQTRKVSESWLKLINDIITTKTTVGKTAMARLAMPDPSLDLRDEIARYLTNLQSEGEPLHEKLRRIEEEQLRVMTVVMHNVIALTKEHGDLRDENTRLKKTQDQIHFQQNEQMAILAQENKELDRKYALAVEKYNIEKSKAEQQDKNLLAIQKEMLEIKKLLKYNEGRCNDIEMRTKKADAGKRTLEVALRNMELSLEKEGKQHRELFEKFSHSGEIINRLKYELEENRCMTSSLEETNRDLQVELKNVKASLEENQQKRNELVEDLANKSKKLNELKEQLDLYKKNLDNESENLAMTQDYTSNLVVKDLTRNVQEKNHHVNELKKKQHQMESTLKEMATREKMLMRQVHDLMKNRSENDVVLKSQVQDLQYKVKDLEFEKAELEKILAQKTLELDQRDMMMREHAKLLQARDELIPMIRDRQDNESQCTEKLMAIVYEHYKSYNPEGSIGNVGDQNPFRSIDAMEKHYGLDPRMVDKELSFRQEKMTEMFNLLEYKQMEINKLERRIREIQGVHHPSLNMMEKAQKANMPKGFFSMFSGTPDSGNQ